MSNLKIIMEPEDKNANFRIFKNQDLSWKEREIEEKLTKLNIVLKNNPILNFDKIYYGFEDDGQIGFYIPTETLLRYAGEILSKCL